MELTYNRQYPSIDDLRAKSRKKIPRFAFEYLDGGCNEDINLKRNRSDIHAVELMPKYLVPHVQSDTRAELFGHTYDAPFGVAPIGLQGMIWPKAPEILAKAAFNHNVPFILSTVSTSSIEKISEITQGNAWFQLYHPAEEEMRNDLLKRVDEAQCPVLVILTDVPVFGFRPRDIRNGLALPPSMSLRNILQIMGRPHWALNTLLAGSPNFATMKRYMPKGLNLKNLGLYMNETFSGWLDEERVARIRDIWKRKLVIKGVVSEEDTEKAIRLGLDGIIVSNHGGRQLDAGQSTIVPMQHLARKYGDQIKIMMDSGVRSGPDVARAVASGADFTFMGRSFMYGVSALGKAGGNHTISLLKAQFQQTMEQLCCPSVKDLPNHLIRAEGRGTRD